MSNSSTQVAVIAIIVKNYDAVDALNALLHEYSACIIGRMGLPYSSRHINIISVALDAPEAVINTLAEKLDAIEHVRASVAYSDAE